MALIKRMFYFFAVNMLVMFTVMVATSIICQVLYGTPTPPTGSLIPIIIWAGVWGMGGAFISLMLSKFMAKKMTGMKIIDPKTTQPQEREIVNMVHNLARQARLPKMPEVGIYQSQEMNAFATGPSRSNSLVAVSTGLLNRMKSNEIEGVMAHEIAHVANGDMVTLTLIQGVINSFVLFFARIIGQLIASQFERNSHLVYIATSIGLQILFGILGSIVVSYFSRVREFKADEGGARFSSRQNMIAALEALKNNSFQNIAGDEKDTLAAFKISTPPKGGWKSLFRSHPPLELRIAQLKRGY